eukprot:4123864-Alexandrium_andersonii.AAC.1
MISAWVLGLESARASDHARLARAFARARPARSAPACVAPELQSPNLPSGGLAVARYCAVAAMSD